MKRNLLFLILIFLVACQPKSIEKDGGLLIEVGYSSENVKNHSIEKTIDVLRNRINSFCYNNPSIQLDSLNNLIRIELPLENDTALYKNLILTKGKFETLETFNNVLIFSNLLQINEILKNNNNFGIHLTDTEFPLFSVLSPSMSNYGQPLEGAIVGYAKTDNIETVNKILSEAEIQSILPENIRFLWSKFKDEENHSLVAIKKPADYKPITDEMIETTRVEKDNYGTYSIMIALKEQFHDEWSNLTRQNIGDFLAIVIDDEVYSSPRVNAEIQGGRSMVSGSLNLEQSRILSSVLNNDKIERDLYIKNLKILNTP